MRLCLGAVLVLILFLVLTPANAFVHGGGVPSNIVPINLTLTDFANKKIYQRVGTTKTITFSGTYAGLMPSSVEVEIINASNSSVVQTWTALSSATISGGSFTGSLSVPQGGWYFWQARSKNSGGGVIGGSTTTSNDFGVGILLSCIGQSNMQNMFVFSTSPPTPNNLTTQISGNSGTISAVTGNGAITLGNNLAVGFGLPIGLLNYAVSGSALTAAGNVGFGYWLDATFGAPYQLYSAGLSAVGGDTEAILWQQGEADANFTVNVSAAAYQTGLTSLITRLYSTTGRNSSTLKFFGGQIDVELVGSNGTWTPIKSAQYNYFTSNTGFWFSGSAADLPVSNGNVHYTAAGMARMGNRYAQAILNAYGLATNGSQGPVITSATMPTGGTVITVAVSHHGGTQLQDGSGGTSGTNLTGWIVNVNGSPVSIASTAIVEPNQITITLASPVGGGATVTLEYLFGVNPISNNSTPIAYDNQTPQGDSVGFPLLPSIGSALDGVVSVTQI